MSKISFEPVQLGREVAEDVDPARHPQPEVLGLRARGWMLPVAFPERTLAAFLHGGACP